MNFPDLILETMMTPSSEDTHGSASTSASSVLDAPYIVHGHSSNLPHSPSSAVGMSRIRHLGPLRYSCLLCDRYGLTADAVHYHCEDPVHQENLVKLNRDKERAKAVLERWNRVHRSAPVDASPRPSTLISRSVRSVTEHDLIHRTEQLGLSAWKDSAQAAFFRYLTTDSVGDVADDQFCAAVTALSRYEYMERVALLELSVWKAVCLAQMPLVADYYAAQHWCQSGWKNLKAVQRKSNAISIIVSTVLPFLEPPHDYSATTVRGISFIPGATARPWSLSATAVGGRGGGRRVTIRASSSSSTANAIRQQRTQALVNQLFGPDLEGTVDAEILPEEIVEPWRE